MAFNDGARLLADIGSTYARFALETERGTFERLSTVKCADYADFGSALRGYCDTVKDAGVRHAAIAISNPVEGDMVRMTNYHWQFSIEQTRIDCGLDTLLVVNDFTALAVGVPHLRDDQRRQIGAGHAQARSVIGLLGAGTGLGVSGLIPADDGWISLGSEGGHVSFSPCDEREIAILEYAWTQYAHVSAERLISGTGLELIYRALTHIAGKAPEALEATAITARGLKGQDTECALALEVFCGILGSVAANLAVTLGAFGGIYIGGSIVPRLGKYFDASPFRRRFEAKGRFSSYVANIPTYVITADNATFVGAAAILDAQLRKRGAGASLLERIRQAQVELSPAERRVANLVLSRPRSILNDPIVEIARAADVSQPTVVRFCRTLGCEGLSDFKLRLASSLTGTIPVTHTQVTNDDSTLELGDKVLGNTASAILQMRDQLNRKTIDQAIDALIKAKRIEFFAVGNYGIVAEDAQYKFLRFGLPTSAYTEPRLQLMVANVLTPDDVVVVVSSTGRINELNVAVDAALARGAKVIAITANQSPLAKRATITIALDHSEDVATQVPMISRVLYLLVIDILAVGVAMRTGAHEKVHALQEGLDDAHAEKPDAAGNRLARMVSHSRS
ncbi:MAG: glucokinase [Betaproteobacteria bacterium]